MPRWSMTRRINKEISSDPGKGKMWAKRYAKVEHDPKDQQTNLLRSCVHAHQCRQVTMFDAQL